MIPQHVPTIGILGGVASGKSLVAGMFVDLGAGLLDADRAGHEALGLPAVEAKARQRWGEAVFGPDRRIDRGKLAEIVFSPPPEGPVEREFLEQLTHPEIARLLARRAEELAAAGTPLVLLDAPLLLEAGWDKLCEKLIFVDAPREERQRRAKARGWSMEEYAARENAQMSVDVKRDRADVIVDNSGSPEQTRTQVQRVWQSLIG